MERGFKSRCEEMARSLRRELGLRPTDPLDAKELADYLGVYIWSVEDLPLDSDGLEQLVERDPDSWSAVTVSASGKEAIIVHPNHRRGRYSSDVMHELAHLLLGHEPSTVFFAGQEGVVLRGFNKELEEEASWLAGALLLPRDALLKMQVRRLDPDSVCENYGVSRRMLDYRTRVTGVERQIMGRRKTARK